MNARIDNELIDLFVDEYSRKIEGMIPDLAEGCDDEDLNDSIYDFACDYIFDRERGANGDAPHAEIRAAAAKIANLYA